MATLPGDGRQICLVFHRVTRLCLNLLHGPLVCSCVILITCRSLALSTLSLRVLGSDGSGLSTAFVVGSVVFSREVVVSGLPGGDDPLADVSDFESGVVGRFGDENALLLLTISFSLRST